MQTLPTTEKSRGKHEDVMNSNLPLSLKSKVSNQCSEIWHLTKEQERTLRSAPRGMEMKILGITLRYRKRATWIRKQTKVENILLTVKEKKWSWAGHMMLKTNNGWTKKVTKWQP